MREPEDKKNQLDNYLQTWPSGGEQPVAFDLDQELDLKSC